MKDIKKLLISLPVFNFILIVVLLGLSILEMYFISIKENSAPVTIVAILAILLLMGGFVVCGFVFGIFKTIKYDDVWKNIVIQIIISTIIIEFMYMVLFFLIEYSHDYDIIRYTTIISYASIITLEQILGYIVGCSIGKLIKYLKNKYNLRKTTT